MGATLGEFEQLLLLALLHLDEDESHGVAIRRVIAERTGRTPSTGAVYTALDRLEAKGYVSSRLGDPVPTRGGRPRRFYQLERAGAKTLAGTLDTLQAMAKGLRPRLDLALAGKSASRRDRR